MYAVVRRYSAGPADKNEVRRLIDEDFLARLQALPGFVSYYAFDDDADMLATVSVYLTKEEADASVQLARDWIADHPNALPGPAAEVFGGEVFSHGGS